MSYETRRMTAKINERRISGLPQASVSADPLRQALEARAAALRQLEIHSAPAPNAPNMGKPWAEAFFRDPASAKLPLATLNAIVAVCDSHDEARAKVNARAGVAPVSESAPARGDVSAAARISAAHAKAHQPKRAATRH